MPSSPGKVLLNIDNTETFLTKAEPFDLKVLSFSPEYYFMSDPLTIIIKTATYLKTAKLINEEFKCQLNE